MSSLPPIGFVVEGEVSERERERERAEQAQIVVAGEGGDVQSARSGEEREITISSSGSFGSLDCSGMRGLVKLFWNSDSDKFFMELLRRVLVGF